MILFDIDGTLVLTGGAGARAMTQAFEAVFGQLAREKLKMSSADRPLADPESPWRRVPFAGRTDTWIVAEMTRLCGIECDDDTLSRFRTEYLSRLAYKIEQPGSRKGVLPGVRPLLDLLDEREDIYIALLTGNYESGARIKLEHFDLWRYFPCGAFAEDAPDRNGLLPSVLDRIQREGGPSFHPSNVIVVGDTPFDVNVALAGGARSLAVATGSFDRDALRQSGADQTLDDLSDLAAVLRAFGLNVG